MTTITENIYCNNFNEMLLSMLEQVYNKVMNLENHINDLFYSPFQGENEEMAKRITRTFYVDGKQRWIRADTEQEYAEKLMALVAGNNIGKGKILFSEYALGWFELYSKPNISTATATSYERQLKRYLIPSFGNMYIGDISVDDVQTLFNNINGAKATKEKAKIVLNMIFEAAIEDQLIGRNPLKSKRLRITGKASVPTKVYSVEQMQFLIKNLDKINKHSDQIYLCLQALHPMRLEEVLGLKWEDIDLEKRIIHIRRAVTHPTRNMPEIKETKTECSARDIGLSEIAVKYLCSDESGFVLGGETPLSYTQVRKMCTRIKKDIGFSENITPIRFRTTVLTDIYDKTHDIKQAQAAAGHASSAMTLKHYIKGRGNAATSAAIIDSTYLSQ